MTSTRYQARGYCAMPGPLPWRYGWQRCGAAVFCLLLAMCSAGKDKEPSSQDQAVTNSDEITLRGTIVSLGGSQGDLKDWLLLLMDQGSHLANSATISSAGTYTLKKVDRRRSYTLALLSPDYVLQAVLAQAGLTKDAVHQYFSPGADSLPRLIQRGTVLSFQSVEAVSFTSKVTSDPNNDGIPDGAASFELVQGVADENPATAPSVDPGDFDMDGDGVPNPLDPDDDNDGIPDWADADSDADGIADVLQAQSDLYGPELVQWAAVNYSLQVQSASSTQLVLTAALQLHSYDSLPYKITMLGSTQLFNKAILASGPLRGQAWTSELYDDGFNEDGSEQDRLYAVRIQLDAATEVSSSSQIILFRLYYGSATDPNIKDVVYRLPPTKLNAISASFGSTTRAVTLSGTPFDGFSFLWHVSAFKNIDTNAIKTYASPPIAGTTTMLVLPSYVSGKSYSLRVVAQAVERISGYPAFSVVAPSISIP